MKLNIGRIVLGGLAAGVVMFLADGLIHDMALKSLWAETMAALGRGAEQEHEHGGMFVFFALHELCRGIAIAWVYAAIRKEFGAGPKTAALAGLAVWAMMFPIPFAAEVPLHTYGKRLLLFWSLLEVIPTVVGALLAGVLYKEPGASAPVAPAAKA